MGQRAKWKKNWEKLMRKSVIGLTFSALLLGLTFHVEAQQPKKVPRIGILSSGSPSSSKEVVEPLEQGLRTLAISRARISPLSTVMLREWLNGCRTLRLSWCNSR